MPSSPSPSAGSCKPAFAASATTIPASAGIFISIRTRQIVERQSAADPRTLPKCRREPPESPPTRRSANIEWPCGPSRTLTRGPRERSLLLSAASRARGCRTCSRHLMPDLAPPCDPVPNADARSESSPASPLAASPPRPLRQRACVAAFRVVRLSYRRWDVSDCPSHQSIRASLGRALTASRVETSAPGVAPLMRLAIHAAVCLSRRMSDVQPLNPD